MAAASRDGNLYRIQQRHSEFGQVAVQPASGRQLRSCQSCRAKVYELPERWRQIFIKASYLLRF